MSFEESLTMGHAGYYAGPQLKGFEKHLHENEYEFHFLPKARCTFVNDKVSHRLPDNSLVFSCPRSPHFISGTDSERIVSWYCFRFSLSGPVPEIIQRAESAFAARGFLELDSSYETLFRELLIRLESEIPLVKTSGKYMFLSILYEMVMLAEISKSFAPGMQHVEKVIQIMQESICGTISLDALARQLEINKSYLIRIFKQKTGASPIQYFNKLKIDNACHLLAHSRLTICEIAERTGFCDEFYFSRMFRKYRKMSPGNFIRFNRHLQNPD